MNGKYWQRFKTMVSSYYVHTYSIKPMEQISFTKKFSKIDGTVFFCIVQADICKENVGFCFSGLSISCDWKFNLGKTIMLTYKIWMVFDGNPTVLGEIVSVKLSILGEMCSEHGRLTVNICFVFLQNEHRDKLIHSTCKIWGEIN